MCALCNLFFRTSLMHTARMCVCRTVQFVYDNAVRNEYGSNVRFTFHILRTHSKRIHSTQAVCDVQWVMCIDS